MKKKHPVYIVIWTVAFISWIFFPAVILVTSRSCHLALDKRQRRVIAFISLISIMQHSQNGVLQKPALWVAIFKVPSVDLQKQVDVGHNLKRVKRII